MGLISRLEKNIAKLEKRIEKEKLKITKLEEKFKSKKITKAKYTIEKRKIEETIKNIKNRIGALKGMSVKEKHVIEEKENK
jgi:chromosome segregation ATPase